MFSVQNVKTFGYKLVTKVSSLYFMPGDGKKARQKCGETSPKNGLSSGFPGGLALGDIVCLWKFSRQCFPFCRFGISSSRKRKADGNFPHFSTAFPPDSHEFSLSSTGRALFLWIFLGPDNCLFPPTVCWGLKWVFERFSTISTQFSTVERENSVESRSNWGAAHAQKHRFPQAHSGHTVPFADLRSGRAYGEGHGSKRQRLHPPLHREKSYKSEMEVLCPIHRERSAKAGGKVYKVTSSFPAA